MSAKLLEIGKYVVGDMWFIYFCACIEAISSIWDWKSEEYWQFEIQVS